MRPLRLQAPAKVNLSLAVVGRRADGLHELRTEMALLELADDLLLLPGCSGLRVEQTAGEEVPVRAVDNLAWQGLRAGLDGEPELACLALAKRVPAAAGLGGGSSDAAAGWRLGRRWRGAPEAAGPEEVAMLAHIGADVPFFAVMAARAWVEGIGQRVSPQPAVDGGGREVVVALPPFRLSTAAVFGELRRADWRAGEPSPGHNDLLAPARRLRPELDDLFELVSAAGAEPRLTGSGPAVYALTDDAERADGIAARLRRAGVAAWRTRLRAEPARIEVAADDEEA